MPDGPSVGYATLQIIPSLRGIRKRIGSEIDRPLEKAGNTAGEKSSRKFAGKFVAGVAVAGTAAGAALVKGVTDAFGEEDVAATIQNQLGIDPATAGRLGDIAAGVYRDAWGDSLSDVGGAVAAAESSLGDAFGATGIEGATTKALAFSKVFDADVTEAISSAGQLLETGLARDADHAFDLLTRSSQEVPAAIRGEVLEASNEYGRFFSQLGLSGSEAFGLLTSAADGGIFGIDKTGDALKELTIRATDMSATSKDAFKAAGLNAQDMADRFLAGGDVARGALQETVAGLLSIEDPTKRANAAIGLFGTPLEDLGTEQIPDFLAQLAFMQGGLGDVEGAADRMVDSLGSTRSAKIEAFRRKALGRLADFTADVLIPAFEQFADWTKENWPKIRRAIGDAVGRVVDIFGDLRDAAQRAIGWLNDNRPILFGIAGVVGTVLVAAVASWTVATWAQVAALWAQAAAFVAAYAPLFAIALAVGALTAGVIWAYQNWDWFRDSVDAVASFMQEKLWPILRDVGGWLAENLPKAFRATVGAVRATWRWLQNLWDRSDGLRGFLADAFMTGVGIAATAISGVRSALETAWTWAKTFWDRTEEVRAFMAGAFKLGLDIAVTAVRGIVSAFISIWHWAQSAWTRTEGLRGFLVGAFKTGIEIAQGILETMRDVVIAIGDGFVAAKDAAQDFVDYVKNIPQSVFDKMAQPLFGGDRSLVQDLQDGQIGNNDDPGFARGGRPPVGRPFWVGEQGPELMMVGSASRVWSHRDSVDLAQRGDSGRRAGSNIAIYPQEVDLTTVHRAEHLASVIAGFG